MHRSPIINRFSVHHYYSKATCKTKPTKLCSRIRCFPVISLTIIAGIRIATIITTITTSICIIRLNFHTTGDTHIFQRILKDFSRIKDNLSLDDGLR